MLLEVKCDEVEDEKGFASVTEMVSQVEGEKTVGGKFSWQKAVGKKL